MRIFNLGDSSCYSSGEYNRWIEDVIDTAHPTITPSDRSARIQEHATLTAEQHKNASNLALAAESLKKAQNELQATVAFLNIHPAIAEAGGAKSQALLEGVEQRVQEAQKALDFWFESQVETAARIGWYGRF